MSRRYLPRGAREGSLVCRSPQEGMPQGVSFDEVLNIFNARREISQKTHTYTPNPMLDNAVNLRYAPRSTQEIRKFTWEFAHHLRVRPLSLAAAAASWALG